MNSTSVRCFVPECPNSKENSTNATFYSFPEELQEEWLIAIGRNRDTFINDEVICSDHFETNDFENYNSLKVLKTDALPSLNLPAKPHLNIISSERIEKLRQKYIALEKTKTITVSSGADCTVLKSNVDKSCIYETVPLNTIKVVVVDTPPHEEGKLSPAQDEFQSDEEEYQLKFEDTLNCRTCLDELGPQGGYHITDVHETNKTLKEMIEYCIPQMASTLGDTDIICNKCLDSIIFCANFIENCLKVEAELFGHVLVSDKEDSCGNVPEINQHILLDHNYLPEPQTSDRDIQETLQPSITPNIAPTRHECPECDKAFKTENYLLDHIRRLHSSDRQESRRKTCKIDCEFCNKSFLTKVGYDLHLQISHYEQVEKRKEDGDYKCKKCERRFSTYGDLTEHKLQNHGIVCKICSMRFDTVAEFNVHYNTHPDDYLCPACGKGFKSNASLNSHMPVHNAPKAYLCDKCGQGFKSDATLRVHLRRHENLKFQCDECPSSFKQKCHLSLHKKVQHFGIQEYKCDVCNKKLSTKANLQKHHQLKHSDVKPYQCDRCGIGFGRYDYLRKHRQCSDSSLRCYPPPQRRKYRYKRGDPALIKCNLCDKVFKDVHMLRLHVKTHTKVRKYKCRMCNLTFTTGSNRSRHEKVHEGSSFRCEVCYRKLETQEALEEHLVATHENSKKYKCHVCGELFGRKYLLHSHVVEQHGNVVDFEKEREVLYKVVMADYLIPH